MKEIRDVSTMNIFVLFLLGLPTSMHAIDAFGDYNFCVHFDTICVSPMDYNFNCSCMLFGTYAHREWVFS